MSMSAECTYSSESWAPWIGTFSVICCTMVAWAGWGPEIRVALRSLGHKILTMITKAFVLNMCAGRMVGMAIPDAAEAEDALAVFEAAAADEEEVLAQGPRSLFFALSHAAMLRPARTCSRVMSASRLPICGWCGFRVVCPPRSRCFGYLKAIWPEISGPNFCQFSAKLGPPKSL